MFEFLEVENNEHKGQVHYQEFSRDIPGNQRLALSDLQIISPASATLKYISRKLLNKYSCIPLFTILPGSKPMLPKHLKKEYWGYIEGEKNVTLYVAMIEPFNLQVLNIIRSVTGYSVVSIPLQVEAANQFLRGDYEKITNSKLVPEVVESRFSLRDIVRFIWQNSIFILFFLVVLIGLLAVKLYIKS